MSSPQSGNRRWNPQMIRGGASQSAVRTTRVAILLSLYNGETYLNAQLDSILAQSHTDWILYWRDDGSTDASRVIMLSFAAHRGHGRCVEITSLPEASGVGASYLHLLESIPETPFVAFADQDDVWHPKKLEWAVDWLRSQPSDIPAIYCARQYLTDSKLNVFRKSERLHRSPCFASALTQNIATGHTAVINSAACHLMHGTTPPAHTLHDWWAYLLTMAAGGEIFFDNRCVSYYRQHSRNTVGAKHSKFKRGLCAIKRGPGAFMTAFESNVQRLLSYPDMLTSESKDLLEDLSQARTLKARFKLIWKRPELQRQTFCETAVFRLWYLLATRCH
ncbi:glycosyltransferase [Gluconobacter japonicus]|uniref:glycosyltransferase n=1 Tax=Gluconobacter japonicus TaxID=376620 RepID=UPI001F21BD2E|nr:glycosyltransferase [Gluconobacter japonicus]